MIDRIKQRTSVKANTLHPIWNEDLTYIVHSTTHQTLTLELWDSDALRPDDAVGVTQVPLSSLDLTPGQSKKLALPLKRMGQVKYHDHQRRVSVGRVKGEERQWEEEEDNGEERMLLKRFGSKPPLVHVEVQWLPFSVQEGDAAAAAADPQRTTPLTQITSRVDNLVHGGMLYVHLSRAEALVVNKALITRSQ